MGKNLYHNYATKIRPSRYSYKSRLSDEAVVAQLVQRWVSIRDTLGSILADEHPD